jgi:hypothetical protein
MKTTPLLFAVLLLGITQLPVQAQDFQAVPPAQRPNAAELAYFGSKNPNAPLNSRDADNIQLVSDFLNELISGQLEDAHEKLADGFRAYGPGFADFLETDDLLGQWERNGRLFTNQHLTLDSIRAITVADGDNRGQWVFVQAVWSAQDNRQQGKPVRITFYELARVSDRKIHRTYTSYGNDQIFYYLGFPLYTDGLTNRRNEISQQR